MTIEVPDELKALAEARAAKAGFSNVDQFVAQLIVGEAAGAPAGLVVDSDTEIEALLTSRASGPFVDMDASDFIQMRKKLVERLAVKSVFPQGSP